jgi:integrase
VAARDEGGSRAAAAVRSCRSCLAWGRMTRQGLCRACYDFARSSTKIVGGCGACGRREPLKRGFCRLCWQQAALERPTGPGTTLAPYLCRVRHQQLFFADVADRRRAAASARSRRDGRERRSGNARVAGLRCSRGWSQLLLFTDGVARDFRYGRVDLRRRPAPDNPWLARALEIADGIAETRGFDPVVRRDLRRTLVMLLTEHRDGELVRSSEFHEVVRKRGGSIKQTREVLATMGILLDDRPPGFERWLQEKLAGLAPGIRSETERWARTLRDGGRRSRPRSPHTVQTYVRFARPALLEWSARYAHLRQVTRDDLLAHAEPLRGQRRQTTLAALRSLFAWAKRNGLVFRDPAARIKVGRLDYPVWQPLRGDEIASTIAAATTPQARLVVALAAVHAARHGAIRALTLDDVDLGNRRLTITGRTRPLDELTHRLLLEWLDHRRRRWPNTANRHLLLSSHSALGHGPVSAPWTNRLLRGLSATIERLRIDRQLEEAVASGADPLHLAVVFDLDESTAIRYAASARQLLQEPHAARLAGSPRTEVSAADNAATEHLGSC